MMVSPGLTTLPSPFKIENTVPVCGLSRGISIFMDSTIARGCPDTTFSPSVTKVFQTLPATTLSTASIPGGKSDSAFTIPVSTDRSGFWSFSFQRARSSSNACCCFCLNLDMLSPSSSRNCSYLPRLKLVSSILIE
jgi:hypothetical protein